jgi:dolichyl-phosphate beta-glucosyltransferase
MKSISIIIPTYNDYKKINSKVKILLNKIKNLNLNYEIIFINDGSLDKTKILIKSIIKKNKYISLINNETNKGKSFSILKALKKSKYKHVILIDSDLPYFSKFNKIISLLKKNYDLVIIDRRHPKSKVKFKKLKFYIILRFIIGYSISLLYKYLINLEKRIIDTQAGLKGFKKTKNMKYNNFISRRFFFDMELIFLYTKLKKKIFSVPVEYKISNSSSINLFNLKSNFIILIEFIKVIINIVSVRMRS